MIELNYQSRVPIYEQIANGLKANILAGQFQPNEQIPSIRDLAVSLGVNPNTVKKSYASLEKQNIIQSFSTRGTFITDKMDSLILELKTKSFQTIDEEVKNLKKLGVSYESIIEGIEKSWKA